MNILYKTIIGKVQNLDENLIYVIEDEQVFDSKNAAERYLLETLSKLSSPHLEYSGRVEICVETK